MPPKFNPSSMLRSSALQSALEVKGTQIFPTPRAPDSNRSSSRQPTRSLPNPNIQQRTKIINPEDVVEAIKAEFKPSPTKLGIQYPEYKDGRVAKSKELGTFKTTSLLSETRSAKEQQHSSAASTVGETMRNVATKGLQILNGITTRPSSDSLPFTQVTFNLDDDEQTIRKKIQQMIVSGFPVKSIISESFNKMIAVEDTNRSHPAESMSIPKNVNMFTMNMILNSSQYHKNKKAFNRLCNAMNKYT